MIRDALFHAAMIAEARKMLIAAAVVAAVVIVIWAIEELQIRKLATDAAGWFAIGSLGLALFGVLTLLAIGLVG